VKTIFTFENKLFTLDQIGKPAWRVVKRGLKISGMCWLIFHFGIQVTCEKRWKGRERDGDEGRQKNVKE
jgi:hypothetical protein